jgi:hypothetical protein
MSYEVAITASPLRKRASLDASTRPQPSMPPTQGKRRMILPLPVAASASLKLTLENAVRMSTSPGSRSSRVMSAMRAATLPPSS